MTLKIMKKIHVFLFFVLVTNIAFSQVYNYPCPYDNTIKDTLDFTNATVGASHSAIVWTGDYVWAIGMKASMTYGITTCIDPFNVRDNDSHISVYTHGGGQALDYNDDDCSNYQYHSTVIFNPPSDGDYDILFDEHTGVYCSHLHDPWDYFDYYIEILNSTDVIDNELGNPELLKIVNVLGNESNENINTLLFYIYDDGTVEKRIVIE
jgi:hypothetical protein